MSPKNINKQTAIMIAAFAAVYLVWGSTYLAIKFALVSIPTFLMGGIRFTVAGLLMIAWARFSRGYEKPTAAHWRTSAIVGFLLLTMGNGGVVLAEHYLSSGMTALMVATLPFWVILIGWLFMKTGRPSVRVTASLVIGFVGVMMLISGGTSTEGSTALGTMIGIAAVSVSTVAWAVGSLYGIKAPTANSPVLAAGMQMLCGGVFLLIAGTVLGEWSSLHLASAEPGAWLALAYLIFFGAIVAFTAYSWLVKNVSPTALSTYAYVNPAIAVILGWAIAGEVLNGTMIFGAAIIVASVALITIKKRGPRPEPVESEDSYAPKAFETKDLYVEDEIHCTASA
jgi:drug/metabolite transporter (DMT)-like permease